MRVVVLDNDEVARATACARLEEALNQVGLRRAELIEGDIDSLSVLVAEDPPDLAFLGPGCYHHVEEHISRFRVVFPDVPLALILGNEVYTAAAVDLRKVLNIRIIPIADVVQMAQFVLDCAGQTGSQSTSANRGVITLTQFKGGVGGTSIAAALAACWVRHDLSVVVVDLDELNPHLSDWSRANVASRRMVAEALKLGKCEASHLREILTYVPGYEEMFAVCPQPENFGEGFHFKADVLEDAPSSAHFMNSLIPRLQDEFDIVLIDAGRSWGISTFAALAMSHRVVMVLDDDRTTLQRSMQNFARVYRESDDANEFDLRKWSMVLNAASGDLLTSEIVHTEVEAGELFPRLIDVHTLPFSERGRNWSGTMQTLFELAEERYRKNIGELAFSLVPFQQAAGAHSFSAFLKRGLQRIAS